MAQFKPDVTSTEHSVDWNLSEVLRLEPIVNVTQILNNKVY